MLASFFETDVGNSVVLVMPTAALVDTVILSRPIPAPQPSSTFVDLSLSGGWGILAYSPEPQVDNDDTQQYLSSASRHLEPDNMPWENKGETPGVYLSSRHQTDDHKPHHASILRPFFDFHILRPFFEFHFSYQIVLSYWTLYPYISLLRLCDIALPEPCVMDWTW